MLPKENRLNLSRKFSQLKKDGRSLPTPFFTILYRASKETDSAQIGFVVSNKIGEAVERNYIRRVLREVFHRNLDNLPKGMEIVVIAKTQIQGVSYEKIDLEVNKILPKLHF